MDLWMRTRLQDSSPTFHLIPGTTSEINTGVQWDITGQGSGMKIPGGTPTSVFFSVPETFLFHRTSVSSTLPVSEIMEKGKYTATGEERKQFHNFSDLTLSPLF